MNENIIDEYPHILKKHSDAGMDINCISIKDFKKMCEVLLTPFEIVEYLEWRLEYYRNNEKIDLSLFFDEADTYTIVRPKSNEALVYQFVAEQYGIKDIKECNQFAEAFSTMFRMLPGRVVAESQEESSYPLILFFSHFNRIEIQRFVERICNALQSSQNGIYNIIGSMRNIEQKYVIFFVASHDGYGVDMDYLSDLARQKGEYDLLLQVFCYWESEEEYRIDYCLCDKNARYL